jgi:hypothetical protein
MVQVETDNSRNVLKLIFSKRVLPEEVALSLEKVEAALAALQPGFRLLTDLSDLDHMDLGCAQHIERSMDLCNRRGVSKVVRVIPDPRRDIGLSIMSLFHYDRRMPIVVCETFEEAVKALEE